MPGRIRSPMRRSSTLTSFPGTESDATISPDGRFVAFLADRDGKFEVFLTQIETGTPTPLGDGSDPWGGVGRRTLTFTADGSELAITSGPTRLVPLIGGAPRPFLGKTDRDVSWSRDNRRVVYMTMTDGDPITVADRDGGNPTLIYQSELSLGSTIMRQYGLPMDSGSTSSTAPRTPTG